MPAPPHSLHRLRWRPCSHAFRAVTRARPAAVSSGAARRRFVPDSAGAPAVAVVAVAVAAAAAAATVAAGCTSGATGAIVSSSLSSGIASTGANSVLMVVSGSAGSRAGGGGAAPSATAPSRGAAGAAGGASTAHCRSKRNAVDALVAHPGAAIHQVKGESRDGSRWRERGRFQPQLLHKSADFITKYKHHAPQTQPCYKILALVVNDRVPVAISSVSNNRLWLGKNLGRGVQEGDMRTERLLLLLHYCCHRSSTTTAAIRGDSSGEAASGAKLKAGSSWLWLLIDCSCSTSTSQ